MGCGMDDDESAAKARRDLLVRALRAYRAPPPPPPKSPRVENAIRVEADLRADLIRAGAVDGEASETADVILKILENHVATVLRRIAGEPDPGEIMLAELASVARLAGDLQSVLSSLSEPTVRYLQFKAVSPPRVGLLGRADHDPASLKVSWQLNELARDLGTLARLSERSKPRRLPKAGPKSSGAFEVMMRLADEWRKATGVWPVSTASEGRAQADLHAAITAYLDAVNAPPEARHGFGDRAFGDAVGDAKALREAPIGGMFAIGALAERRLKRNARRKRAKPQSDN